MTSRNSRGSAGERAAAEGRAVHAGGDDVDGLLVDEDCTEGEAAGERLGGRDDIGVNFAGLAALLGTIPEFVGEIGAGATESALDLVEDQQSVVRAGGCLGGEGELAGDLDDAAFAHDGLEEDGAGVLVDRRLERGDVVGRDELDTGDQGGERLAVLVLAGDGKRA